MNHLPPHYPPPSLIGTFLRRKLYASTQSSRTVPVPRDLTSFLFLEIHLGNPILEIPWRQLPLICALGRPLGFIPTSHVIIVRRALIHCLQALADSPFDETLWKRILLLPTVLFIDIGKSRRADLDTKVDLILADTWPFLVGEIPGRLEKTVSNIPANKPSPGSRPGHPSAQRVQVIGLNRDPDNGG